LGGGSPQAFTFIYSDQNGYLDLGTVSFLIKSTLSTPSSCFVQYSAVTNTIYLHNDADTGVTSAPLGSAGSLSNSQCSLNVGASTSSGSGNNLTLNVLLTFTPSFAGAKNVYMASVNASDVFSGWIAKGTWTVP
jgi:hypothetical protein